MALDSVITRNNYIGSNSASVYNYTFKIFQKEDLSVYVRLISTGVETKLVEGTDYTVSGVKNKNGGSITLVNASQAWLTSGNLSSNYAIALLRIKELKQKADIKNQGDFYPEIHEDVFDGLVMNDQRLQDQASRSLKFSESINPSSFNTTLPPSLIGVSGAKRTFVVNGSGNGLELGPTTDEIALAQGYSQAADDARAAAVVAQTAAELAETNAEASEVAAAASAAAAAQSAIDAANASTQAVDDHIAEPDPHPQYLTQTEGDAAYLSIGALSAHESATDPHPQYETSAEAQAKVDAHAGLTNNPHSTTKAQVGLANVTNDAQLTRAAGDINSFAAKSSVVNADVFLIEDSADSFNKKKITFAQILEALMGVPAPGTVRQAAITFGTTAVRLTSNGLVPPTTRRRLQFIIEPGGADNFFYGSSGVTSSGANRGVRLYPGTAYTFENDANDYYIISDTASQTVFITEVV